MIWPSFLLSRSWKTLRRDGSVLTFTEVTNQFRSAAVSRTFCRTVSPVSKARVRSFLQGQMRTVKNTVWHLGCFLDVLCKYHDHNLKVKKVFVKLHQSAEFLFAYIYFKAGILRLINAMAQSEIGNFATLEILISHQHTIFQSILISCQCFGSNIG